MVKKNYTFVEKLGNRIFHRFVDDEGQHHIEVTGEFPISFYLPKEDGKARSLYGDALGEKRFENMREAKEFQERYKDVGDFEIFGQEDLVQQFIAHAYPRSMVFDLADYTIVSVDIEVEHDDGFPEPDVAKEVIMSICIKVFGGESICFDTKPDPEVPGIRYIQCADEIDLLIRFMATFRAIAPHFMTGWNVYGFDVPYLVNRINNVIGPNAANDLSIFTKASANCIQSCHSKEGTDSYKILGLTVLDYQELYKKFHPDKQESYALAFIADVEEVGEKVTYEEYGNSLMRLYRENHKKFIHYNDVDNQLVELLDKKLQFIQLAVAIAMLTKSRYSDATGTVKIWDNLIYHMCLADGVVVPPNKRVSKVDNAGGFVREPRPGLHRWPVIFDLTSLYPSIARMLNLSPETQCSEPMGGVEMADKVLSGEIRPEDYTEEGVCFAINGARFRTDIDGVVAKAMSFVFYERKRYKDLMKVAKNKLEALKKEGSATPAELEALALEVSKWDAFQKAVKVVNNGGYGAIGNVGFRYFRPAISEAITVTGQYVIRFIALRLNEYLNAYFKTKDHDYVLGSDTDSVMLTLDMLVQKIDPERRIRPSKLVDVVNDFCENRIEKFLEDEYAKLAVRLNAKNNTLDMKREAICDVGLFRAKKNYILRVYDMEHVRYAKPQLKIAGIETQRSDKPKACRVAMKEIIPIIFDGNEKDMQSAIAKFKAEFMELPLSKISFPKGVSEVAAWTNDDGSLATNKGTVPINSRAAVVYNHLLSKHPDLRSVYHPIKNKTKIKYVYLKEPNPTMGKVVGFIDELPKEFDLDRFINKDLQFEKTFLSPMQSLLSLPGVNWQAEESASLFDLFE